MAEAVELEIKGGEGGGAFVECFACGLLLEAFEGGGDGIGANIRAGSFAGVGEAHRLFLIVLADGHVQEAKLSGGIVQKHADELLHQLGVILRDAPELIAVQHSGFVEYSHQLIVS